MSKFSVLHREIMRRKLGRKIPSHLVVDHKDRNRRNSTRDNLRLVTVKTNNWNRSNVLLWDGERWVYEPHGNPYYVSVVHRTNKYSRWGG